ncbi:MAG: IS4 family transposase [Polyangiales bacterium]
MTNPILKDWAVITSLLPANWEQLADKHKLLQLQYGGNKIKTASELLRLILVNAGAELPLRQTVALVAQSGGPDVSPMRLHKKMCRAAPYLQELLCTVVGEQRQFAPEHWAGYEVSLVDASVVSRPGSVNGDARIHTRMRLTDLRYLQVISTGIEAGEGLWNFCPVAGELVIGDRGYCHARGMAYAKQCGADVLIRFNHGALPVTTLNGETLDLWPLLRALRTGHAHEVSVLAHYKDGSGAARSLPGRLCMQRLPKAQAEKAKKRVLKEHGSGVSEQTLEMAQYVIVLTTAEPDRLSAEQCLQLYRLRWQIELQFKRWKSICGFDRMPNHRPDTIQAWLYAKLLSAVLLEKLSSLRRELSPPIDRTSELATALETDQGALAHFHIRALADEALRRASQHRRYH